MNKPFKMSWSTLITLSFSASIMIVVLGYYFIQLHEEAIKKQVRENRFNRYISLGRTYLSHDKYTLANNDFILATSLAASADETKQASQLLGNAELKFAFSNPQLSIKVNDAFLNAMKIETKSHNINGRGLIEYSIGLLDEKSGLNYEKENVWNSAISLLKNSEFYMNKANVDGFNNRPEMLRVDYELGTIQLKSMIKKAEQQWKDGHNDQAIQTLQNAITKRGKKADIQTANLLLKNYESKLATIQQQQAQQAQQQQIADEKANMNKYDGGGNAEIAVSTVVLEQSTDSHTAGSGMTFIKLWIGVMNNGTSSEDVNPLYFTLSTPDGQTAPVYEDTYGLSNYLDVTTIDSGQQVDGWLIFYLPQETQYTLNYQDDVGNTDHKTIIA